MNRNNILSLSADCWTVQFGLTECFARQTKNKKSGSWYEEDSFFEQFRPEESEPRGARQDASANRRAAGVGSPDGSSGGGSTAKAAD